MEKRRRRPPFFDRKSCSGTVRRESFFPVLDRDLERELAALHEQSEFFESVLEDHTGHVSRQMIEAAGIHEIVGHVGKDRPEHARRIRGGRLLQFERLLDVRREDRAPLVVRYSSRRCR